MEISLLKIRPTGYAYLLKKWGILATGMHRSNIKNGAIEDIA